MRLFPVHRELLGDGLTPVAVYARLRGQEPMGVRSGTFLLESVIGGERWARYSFVGVGARARVTGRVEAGTLRLSLVANPGFEVPMLRAQGLEGLRELPAAHGAEPALDLPRFWGGLVGVWGHDVVRAMEDLPAPIHGLSELPALEAVLTDTLVIFDNLTQRMQIVATCCPESDGGEVEARRAALARIDVVLERLSRPTSLPTMLLDPPKLTEPRLAPQWQAAGDFPGAVERAKRHIAAGDVFQVVLSQRFDVAKDNLEPLDVYRMLRVTDPAPYMMLVELPSASLVGASPEVLVRVDRDERTMTVRPIAGTRPRGGTEAEDLRLEAELLADPKERAEHLMLIDLGRNDVGRVCEPGSVQVTAEFTVERYSRVMHLVSEVVGILRADLDAIAALRSAFPAGTLSGAPKVRALELIDELEPAPRGWYGGALGYLGYDGGADFAICIRSAVFVGDTLRVQAGAGVVFDSDPHEEDRECHRKASAVLRAIEMARQGRGSL